MEVSKNSNNYHCKSCHHKHCDEDGDLPGSNGPASIDKWEIPDVIVSRICLLPMVTEASWRMIWHHTHYKNNHLLRKGGIDDQPNSYMQAMEIIEGCQSD